MRSSHRALTLEGHLGAVKWVRLFCSVFPQAAVSIVNDRYHCMPITENCFITRLIG
jgi:hypothetical protein